jgi:hypothetical protein
MDAQAALWTRLVPIAVCCEVKRQLLCNGMYLYVHVRARLPNGHDQLFTVSSGEGSGQCSIICHLSSLIRQSDTGYLDRFFFFTSWETAQSEIEV